MTKQAVVLYHANCTDGFGAAWAFSKVAAPSYSNVQYLPVTYNQPIPAEAFPWSGAPEDLYILDFSYPMPELEMLASSYNTVTILDHHIGAKEILEEAGQLPNVTAIFDNNKSGAGLTWDYLALDGEPRPLLINYIEDRDLWKFELPASKAVNAVIQTTKHEFLSFSILSNHLETSFGTILVAGEFLLKQEDKYVQSICALARKIQIADYEVPFVECPGMLASVVGNQLAGSSDFSVTYHTFPDGSIKFSLRAGKDCPLSMADLAKLWGGGGHHKAAGFSLSRENLDYLEDLNRPTAYLHVPEF